jgi:hypothetical protein
MLSEVGTCEPAVAFKPHDVTFHTRRLPTGKYAAFNDPQISEDRLH